MKVSTVVRIVVVLVIVVFFGHQLYSSVYKPIKTDNTVYYETVDGLSVTGTIMRNETLVTSNVSGVYHYLVSDGNRVASGGIIANIYDTKNASMTMSEIDTLSAQLADMNELQNYNNQQATDLQLITERVNDSMRELVGNSAGGNYENYADNLDSVLHNINRRQVVTGQTTDFSTKINEMQKKLEQLQAALPNAKGQITASMSGYFSNTTDGYETVLTGGDLATYTPEYMDKMQPKTVGENVVGKIVSDYDWYILAKMPLNDSLRYKVGDKLTVETEVKSGKELPVTVAQINVSQKKDSAVVVFSCSEMSRELASMRTGSMTIVNQLYKGLKIAKSALREVDSVKGVYIVSGITLEFVPINILYSNDDYIICEQQQSNDKVLRLYDEVVVKGKNLYDGKVIN